MPLLQEEQGAMAYTQAVAGKAPFSSSPSCYPSASSCSAAPAQATSSMEIYEEDHDMAHMVPMAKAKALATHSFSEQQLAKTPNSGELVAPRHSSSFHVLFPERPMGMGETAGERGNQNQKQALLLRFHAGHFRIGLGLAAQTVLLKTLKEAGPSALAMGNKMRIPAPALTVYWGATLSVLLAMCGLYAAKMVRHMDVVRLEYRDRVRVNYLFVPWITAMVLAMGWPWGSTMAVSQQRAVWSLLMAPLTVLEMQVYGQWFTRGSAFLSRVANPSTHLAVIGNFEGARMAVAYAGWPEAALFFFTVGIVHYAVLFITLYQRLPSNSGLPKRSHPIFFLFVAAPSVASIAWNDISSSSSSSFDMASRILFFLSLFLYSSLVVRVKLFKQAMSKFRMVWWAYAYPMTAVGIAAVRYAQQDLHLMSRLLALLLSFASMAAVLLLLLISVLDMVMWSGRGLFPNDMLLLNSQAQARARTRATPHKRKSKSEQCRNLLFGFVRRQDQPR